MNYTITIDLDKKCAECGKGGAVPNGLCLKCTSKAFDPRAKMKTSVGRAVQRRWQEQRKQPPR